MEERKAWFSKNKKTGKWGVTTTFPVEAGDTIDVTKRSGEAQAVTIEKVTWEGDDRDGLHVWLCAIKNDRKKRRRESDLVCPHCGKRYSDKVDSPPEVKVKQEEIKDEDIPF